MRSARNQRDRRWGVVASAQDGLGCTHQLHCTPPQRISPVLLKSDDAAADTEVHVQYKIAHCTHGFCGARPIGCLFWGGCTEQVRYCAILCDIAQCGGGGGCRESVRVHRSGPQASACGRTAAIGAGGGLQCAVLRQTRRWLARHCAHGWALLGDDW